MIALKNIHSLSDFLRNAKTRIARLKKTGEPATLTANGEAEAVVLSAAAYQKLLDEREMAVNLHAIDQGMLEAQRGEGMPAAELIRHLRGGKKRRRSA